MFDTSYARSRVYFKTLEILRIFGDIIRETGRDLQEMDPERLLQGSFLRAGWDARYFLRDDPATDKALWKNWRILSEFQKGAEERLMRRINEKTEEIKSLRDGVSDEPGLLVEAKSDLSALQRDFSTRGSQIDDYEPICHRLYSRHRAISSSQLDNGKQFIPVLLSGS
jgi:hypothetical protein